MGDVERCFDLLCCRCCSNRSAPNPRPPLSSEIGSIFALTWALSISIGILSWGNSPFFRQFWFVFHLSSSFLLGFSVFRFAIAMRKFLLKKKIKNWFPFSQDLLVSSCLIIIFLFAVRLMDDVRYCILEVDPFDLREILTGTKCFF